ncbi:hypothetical protein CspHIS471_0700830 [Cutaneotrichosporon sp. HIS471]|nr:hypothetical protein CspHIS471_0700830 [Cutaneotrichosporon sp. HIS471]
MSDLKQVVLDHTLFPHIISRVGFFAPQAIRVTSRKWRERVDNTFLHWRIGDRGFNHVNNPNALRRIAPYEAELPRARYVDVMDEPDPRWTFPHAEIVRYFVGSESPSRLTASTVIAFRMRNWDGLEGVDHLVMSLDHNTAADIQPGFVPASVTRVTVLMRTGTPYLLIGWLFQPMGHRIALGDLDITVVCTSKCKARSLGCYRTSQIKSSAMLAIHRWRLDLASRSLHKFRQDDSSWMRWPADDVYASELNKRFNSKPLVHSAARVRHATLDEWREQVGNTVFRLATDPANVVE